ncbi:MAG: cupin domain-containing protein [Calditrichaeota bacterium]|nr:cupin domain-containing protein [Calditrichota bacterium]MCB9391762.1 cupin domain-containing protein [Calditrichota bacterium]
MIKRLLECEEFTAGDETRLREILHPDKASLALGYSLAYAKVGPGVTSLLHKLRTSEVYYILKGRGKMELEGEETEVGPGDTIYIAPYSTQRITGLGPEDLEFLCIVDPAWREEDEEIL